MTKGTGRSPRGRRIALAVTLVALALALFSALGGCVPLLSYSPRDPTPGPLPIEVLADNMNPFVLTGSTGRRLLVEVDWEKGSEPSEHALDGLRAVLAKYSPPGRPFVVERGHEVTAGQPDNPVWRWRRLPPGILRRDPRGPDELVLVLYAAKCPFFGFTRPILVSTGAGDPVAIPSVVMCMDTAREAARLTITPQEIERATLIHEFGHVLGLVTNARHAKPRAIHECANVGCVVTHPTPRAIAANLLDALLTGRLPRDYCRACREDIRRAQEYWHARAAADAQFVETLEQRRRAEDAIALAAEANIEGKPDLAVDLYRSALKALPHRTEIPHRLATLLARRGEVDEAIRLVQGKPRELTAEAAIALALCGAGRHREAASRVERTRLRENVEDVPNDWWGYGAVACALEGTGRTREAAEWLAGYPRLEHSSEWKHAHRRAASLYRVSGGLDSARELIEARLKDPQADVPSWLVERARLAFARGAPDAAHEDLRAAISKMTHWDESSGAKALALALAGDRDTAYRTLDESALDLDREHVGWHARANRARTLALLGDVEGALAAATSLTPQGRAAIWFDPCLDEDLASVRRDPRAKHALPWCFGSR